MANIIKVKCNGPNTCVNEVDLDNALHTGFITKAIGATPPPRIPERIVRDCKHCTQGKVIVTRQMIEENT